MDPAETHWQGPRTAAAASLHKAAAGQGDSGRDRALETRLRSSKDLACWLASMQGGRAQEAREHARRAVDPAETHWQGPRTAAEASLRKAAAGQGDSSQDRAQEAREHARRAVDPAETYWQGHRIAAAASQHEAAAGQGDSSQDRALEAREHTLAELWIPRRRIGKGIG